MNTFLIIPKFGMLPTSSDENNFFLTSTVKKLPFRENMGIVDMTNVCVLIGCIQIKNTIKVRPLDLELSLEFIMISSVKYNLCKLWYTFNVHI